MKEKTIICLSVLFIGMSALSVRASVIEVFDYGTTEQNLVGLGGSGDGWSGAWTGATTSANYINFANLTYNAAGYNNALNPATGSGVARQIDSSDAGTIITRPLDGVTGGTIWVSTLMRTNGTSSSNSNQAILWMRGTEIASPLANVGVGIRGFGEDTYMRYNNVNAFSNNIDSQGNAISRGAVNLVLTRLTIDYDANGFDRAEVWFNPDLTGGIAGLGAAKIVRDGANVLGTGIDRIGVSFQEGTTSSITYAEIDGIRISNAAGEQGLLDVTAIPEPSTFMMMLIPGVLMLLGKLVKR